MSELFGPFNAGAGANFDETQWRELMNSLFTSGVVKGAKVNGSAGGDLGVTVVGTGLQLRTASGCALAIGFAYENTANLTKTLSTADATLNRIDYLVIELDFVARTCALTVLVGTLASSPVLPTLTQSATKWDIPLASCTVNHGVTLLTSGMLTDRRVYSALGIPPVMGPGSGLNADTLDGQNSSAYLEYGAGAAWGNAFSVGVGPIGSRPAAGTKGNIYIQTPFS
jgi:hypothetical protein